MSHRTKSIDKLFKAILTLKSVEDCYNFFEDACTVKEIIEISQRFEVACMLNDKRSYQSINEETGVSSATIGRVNKCLVYGAGGYKKAIGILSESECKND